MTPEELKLIIEQGIKESHACGIQSGLKQNSDLVDMIIHKMENKLEPIINKLVNGKIDNLTKMQSEQNDILGSIQEEQGRVKIELEKITKETGDIEKKTEPIVTEYNNKKTVNNYFSGWGSKLKEFWAVAASVMGLAAFFYWIIGKIK